MKHAGAATLQQLSNLLDQIRQRGGLKEKKLGIFYRKSKSFLHFHEDPAGMFADISSGDQFHRFPVNTMRRNSASAAGGHRSRPGKLNPSVEPQMDKSNDHTVPRSQITFLAHDLSA
jgi:hypothetical protein